LKSGAVGVAVRGAVLLILLPLLDIIISLVVAVGVAVIVKKLGITLLVAH
jgi:hypothetical protein